MIGKPLGDAVQFLRAAPGRIAVACGDGADAGELVAEQGAFLRVELAALGAVADEAGRGQGAGHGPVAVGIEDLE